MHLKSLELQGYKTFAGRTTFELADRITCIVGPNGSGKSNVADAIRWVLGEQAYSLLRGKKTIDMIFQGSEQRSRAGMASAEILFDNSSGWLPVDFSEVSIGRRAYRDGSNEYFINGQKVRLKDISELLGNSGLSERTYTIIGQGLVDSALSLRADERRRLFEEAAGIGLYRARREEAQRRLDNTLRNLERVEDILSELKPRLRSLERQAQRANQYDQVQTDLQVLLKDWYGYHWNRAMHELNVARVKAREHESYLQEAQRKQTDIDQEISGYREHIQGVRARLSSWHRELSQLHARRETITRELAVSDERMRSLMQQQQNSTDEVARYEQQIVLYQERLTEAETEAQRLQAELSDAQAKAAEAREQLKQRQSERSEAEKNIRQGQARLADLSAQQTRLNTRLEEHRTRAERRQAELLQAEEALSVAEGELQTAQARLTEAESAVQQAQAARQTAQKELDAHRQQTVELEAERKQILEQQSKAQAELARSNAQLDVLEQADKALSGYTSGTQALLKSAQKGALGGAQGALSSQLHVPEAYEAAIAIALGEYLDAVLLEGGASVENALEVLASETARGAMLPLDALIPPEPLTVKPADGVVGLASDLVQAQPEYRPAVDLLLGHTIIVDDRKTARRVLAGLPQTARAVTLQGEIFYASGPVMSGQMGGASTLSRPRQRRELRAQIEATQKQLHVAADALEKLDQTLKARVGDERNLVSMLDEARREVEAAERRRGEVVLEVTQARRQADWQRTQQGNLRDALQHGETESRQMVERISALEAESTQAHANLRQLQSKLNAISLEEFQLEANHWDTQAAVVEQALKNTLDRQRERNQTVADASHSFTSIKSRLAHMQAEMSQLDQTKNTLRNQEAELITQVDALQALIDPADAELVAAEAQQDSLMGDESQSRNKLSAADRRNSQAQLTLTRCQEALDRWRERIEADFGLVSFEYDEQVSGPTPLPLGSNMVQELPVVEELPEGLEETIKQQRAQLRRIGAVNPDAQREYEEVSQRHTFMTAQVDDSKKAEADIREVITELDVLMEREFRITFDAVAAEFRQIFTRLFGGGSAQLVLTDPGNMTDTGIDIEARLPGRRTQGLSLLSGGERSLTATALVFALLKVSPTPFCVLDEVDAMLDEANVGRFRDLLRELAQNTQFIVITHNRNTVQAADVIYGVTKGRDTASQVISLKLDEVADVIE